MFKCPWLFEDAHWGVLVLFFDFFSIVRACVFVTEFNTFSQIIVSSYLAKIVYAVFTFELSKGVATGYYTLFFPVNIFAPTISLLEMVHMFQFTPQ